MTTARRLFVAISLAGLAVTPALAGDALYGDVRQLTFEGKRAGEGYFSADGSKMIFQSEREPGNPFYQMYLLDLETGDVERVSPGHGKTTCGWIHPSGERVLYASTQTDPDARRKMREELEFRASGQERRYAWDYDQTFDIQEYDLTTGKYRQLTDALGYDAEGAYSPDGTQIVFASNRAAYEADLSAEDAARLVREPSYFMDLYVMDADGSGLRRLTTAPGYDGGPFWSADGEQIVWRRFAEDGATAEIFTMNADGSGETQVTDLGVMSWAPFFHPSGDYIIFSTNQEGFANFELYMVDAAGAGEPVRVTEREGFDGLATFTPDGETLSWTSNATADGTSQIFLASWDDEAARRRLGLAGDGAAAAASALTPAIELTEAAIRAADVRRHVEALASDVMAGRLTGTEGEQLATAYVADAFAALGLDPAGDNGSFFQPFPFTAGVSLGDENGLQIAIDGETRTPALNEDWRPLAFSRTGPAAEAPVAFAGFGVVASADGDQDAFDSYGDLDVEGRWVLLYRGLPNDIASERRVHLSRFADLRYKTSVAKSKGAVGVIVAPAPGIDYDDELPRLTYESTSGEVGLPVVAVDRALAGAMLTSAAIESGLDDLETTLDGGEQGRGVTLDAVQVSARVDLAFEERTGRNVLARLDLDGPADAPPLVIGAHVDHLGRGETSGSLADAADAGAIHYGADDNASGVAALIEIAQSLAADHGAGELDDAVRDVVFAAWSGEELGLLGSSHYVDALKETAGTDHLEGEIAAYLNMDMVGRLEDRLVLAGLGSSEVWAREIERRNAVVGLPIATNSDTYLPTDATQFYLARVPILSAFTGAHEDYHTPNDTADTLNYDGTEQVARLMALIARSQVRTEELPAYVEVERPSGQGGRRMAGVFLGTIPDYAEEGQVGVPISGVVKGGPAEEAGLAGGDVIVGLAGADLSNIYDYVRVLNGLKVGEPVDLVVVRKGERVALEVTPAIREQ